ncbi:hypothetical protein [Mycolicibacterium lutetiense]|uniref:Uncharacterized protein n=1 Tax=Mycolicibacterium lutetiense TaxID=1641992 RepID=A0ABS5A1P6_9MYCO|nr:hypothetical protein [Mycolicibacterium lutetiense]MBP2455684.1 hypothetical protein [Mycolicibacterium lutetiense]
MTDDEFWSATAQLKLIHQWARARYVAPWALLLAVLLRVIASTSHRVMLPGPPAPASLNMAIVLLGRSGSGKGVTDKLARLLWSADIHEEGLGSGQGIHELFKETKDPEDRITRALFTVSEIDHLTALASGRENNTLAAVKAGLTGDRLGSKGASSATTRSVPADSYRLCLSISAQYGHTAVILDDVSGGTPQRVVWGSVTDPTIPDTPGPEPDHVLDTNLPDWALKDKPVILQYGTPDIAEYVAAGLLANQRGEVDAIDGHRTLTRLKVAAALAILDHRMVVSARDWELSEAIMAQSDATRATVLEYDRQAARAKARERAMSRAAGEQFISDHKLDRAKKSILRWLERDGQLARHDLRRKLKADLRDHFDPAIAELAAGSMIAVTSVKNGVEYGLSGEGTRVPEVHPTEPQVIDRVPEVHRVPSATVTELDSRRSGESDSVKLSAPELVAALVAERRAAGETTITSLAVHAAGKAAGHTKASITNAVTKNDDMVRVNREGGTVIYSIDGTGTPCQSFSEWARDYIRTLPANNEFVNKDDFARAAEAAGHNAESASRTVLRTGLVISEPDPDNGRETRWRIVQDSEETA